ncbi:MAG: hypothetical protein CVU39_10245 [Chloroflexi bacterium HGW-Chloroflexi-10]|nr:MAG: hypothetical protein CVU39_10245 [Chloroflexi bacterium HGW-Chloroflexi-10]
MRALKAMIFAIAVAAVALWGVFQWGETLQAPFSIKGVWEVSLEKPLDINSSCWPFESGKLNIIQSGTHLVISDEMRPDQNFIGTLTGNDISITWGKTSISASMEGGSVIDRMDGEISGLDCDTLRFSAERVSQENPIHGGY